MEARTKAEEEQERLKAEKLAPGAAPPPSGASDAGGAAGAPAAAGAADNSLGARLGAAAGKFWAGLNAQGGSAVEETSQMLAAVTKDREKLTQRLAAETDARKRLEREKRELEVKLSASGATSDVNSRKALNVHAQLARKKEELSELRAMMQQQTIE